MDYSSHIRRVMLVFPSAPRLEDGSLWSLRPWASRTLPLR